MARNFYFGKQADVVAGSANFASLINATPSAYGLTAGQATAFGVVNSALQTAFTAAITPETRTPVTVQQKDIAIRNMRTAAINLAKIIYSTASVTDAQLVSLGLLPRPTFGPQPTPVEQPVVEVVSVINRLVTARIHTGEGTTRAKAAGAFGVQVYSFVGDEPPTDPRQYHYEGISTRGNKVQIQFPNSVASGATAWIAAAWLSSRGFPGVACTPVQVTIQGGPVLAEAA